MKRQLERQVGVQKFAFDINTGIGELTFGKDEKINLNLIKETVKATGFDLKWADLQFVAELLETEDPDSQDILAAQIIETGQRVLIGPGDSDESQKYFVEVRRWLGDASARLRLRGRAHAHADGTIGLAISSFKVLGH